jgi:hypothetical protein
MGSGQPTDLFSTIEKLIDHIRRAHTMTFSQHQLVLLGYHMVIAVINQISEMAVSAPYTSHLIK